MTPSELLDFFRIEVDDLKTPPLWSDEDIDRYMDKAQRAFARATDCFLDSTTKAVTQIPIKANEALVTLSPLVTKIRRAELASSSRLVRLVTMAEMDEGALLGHGLIRDYGEGFGLSIAQRWRLATGEPRFAVTDFQADKLLLAPKPTSVDTLALTTYRLPLKTILNSESPAFEIIDEDHQYGLLLYMQKLAYMKQDADTYNPKRSAAAEKEWLAFIADARRSFPRVRHHHKAVAYGGL